MSYEVADMENAVAMAESGNADVSETLAKNAEKVKQLLASPENGMYLEYTRDVMKIMTDIRKQWHMTYPEEE